MKVVLKQRRIALQVKEKDSKRINRNAYCSWSTL